MTVLLMQAFLRCRVETISNLCFWSPL